MFFLSTACGYHLRGNVDLPKALNNVFIANASHPLKAAFKKAYDHKLVKSITTAKLVIKILTENLSRHTISTDTSGYSNEFTLVYHIDFNILDGTGKLLSAKQRIKLRKSYFNQQSGDSLLAKNNEEAVLRQQLYNQAVYAISSKIKYILKK
jgi:LPS-assembly lipoprotein